jgi:hypothetical protein
MDFDDGLAGSGPAIDVVTALAHSRGMPRSLFCLLGRHDWRRQRNPEVGGSAADFDVCSRCGKERNRYEGTSGTQIGGVGA